MKNTFPNLKIGGPAICYICDQVEPLIRQIFDGVKANGLQPDFFSFHGYKNIPEKFVRDSERVYSILQDYGWQDTTEMHINEWNYISGWLGNDFSYSCATIQGLKGASFTAATMCAGQGSKIDMLMYYDARPCAFNGLFQNGKKCKTYYTFSVFSKLYQMGTSVSAVSDDTDIYCVAAKNEDTSGLLVTYYSDDDTASAKEVAVQMENVAIGDVFRVNYYLLDGSHDLALLRSDKVTVKDFTLYLNMPLHTSYYIEIIKC